MLTLPEVVKYLQNLDKLGSRQVKMVSQQIGRYSYYFFKKISLIIQFHRQTNIWQYKDEGKVQRFSSLAKIHTSRNNCKQDVPKGPLNLLKAQRPFIAIRPTTAVQPPEERRVKGFFCLLFPNRPFLSVPM